MSSLRPSDRPALTREQRTAAAVERALTPLRAHLSLRDFEEVQAVVESELRVDPVIRALVCAMEAHGAGPRARRPR